MLAWAGISVVTSMLVRRIPHPLEGPRPVAAFLVLVAAGQLLGRGLHADSSLWRLVVPMVVAGVGTGVLNAVLGREAIASVPAASAAMGSGANQTGALPGRGRRHHAVRHCGHPRRRLALRRLEHRRLVAGALTLLGAAAIALTGRRRSASSCPRPSRRPRTSARPR